LASPREKGREFDSAIIRLVGTYRAIQSAYPENAHVTSGFGSAQLTVDFDVIALLESSGLAAEIWANADQVMMNCLRSPDVFYLIP
jgi:hypothetical protein